MIRKFYDYILGWAETPYGSAVLFILAFVEAIFFPLPPDILLIALCLSIPSKSFKYALICVVGSVVGGCVGYFIGMKFMEQIGYNIFKFYHILDKFDYISGLYKKYDAWAVAVAGFTPIPYKLITISSGAFNINFKVFFIASLVSRTLRFFAVASLIFIFGAKIKSFIDKYFNILAVIFTALLIGGFILIKMVL